MGVRTIKEKKEFYRIMPHWVRDSRIDNMVAQRMEGYTLQHIGDQWGLTRERVRQLVNQGYADRGMNSPQPKDLSELRREKRDKMIIQKVKECADLRKGCKAIAEHLNMSYGALAVVLRRNNFSIPLYCQRCGAQLVGREEKWCRKCAVEIRKYPNWSPEKKRRHIEWIKRYKEKRKVMV
jgi:ribosomal protein L37E